MTIDSLIAHYGLAAIFLGAGTEGEAAAVAGGIVAHRKLIALWQVGLPKSRRSDCGRARQGPLRGETPRSQTDP
jgi:hypothetical protein